MKTKEIKEQLRPSHAPPISAKDCLSTGSTLLNLAISGKPSWGFVKGHYYWIVGDSVSGKTWLSLTCLAEASLNASFKDYRFIYDNNEGGALMDIERFFGKEVARRLEMPSDEADGPAGASSTIEEFFYHIDDALKDGRPFIYILDSMDSLSSESEQNKFQEQKKAHLKDKEVSGSYGDGKAKKNSANLRQLLGPLAKSGSILIVISQTRDNIGFGSQFNPKTHSGGHALKFYATVEIWSSVKATIERDIKGKRRQLGVLCKIKTKKNRITGRERVVYIPIFHSFGIDDVGADIDYLLDEGHWTERKKIIIAPEFKLELPREKLIRQIEEQGLEKDLRMIVGDVWKEIEDACNIHRKSRYE